MTKTNPMVKFQRKGWMFVTKNQLIQFNRTFCNVDNDEEERDDHDDNGSDDEEGVGAWLGVVHVCDKVWGPKVQKCTRSRSSFQIAPI